MELFTHTYSSKAVHNYLKDLSERIVYNEHMEYIREVALNTMIITHGRTDHLIPSALDNMRTSFYRKAKKYIPESYIQDAQKTVGEWLSKPAEIKIQPRPKSLLSRVFSSI